MIKLIAWLTLSRYMPGTGPAFAELKDLDSESLRTRLEHMERGGVFRDYAIRNFLEADFFGWYLRAWSPGVETQVRNIITMLSDYDPATLEVSPEQSRDLLKKLYHYLMPRELRHDLGEYYTPDWLAERLLSQVDVTLFQSLDHPNARRQTLAYARRELLRLRFLDPACGSGTFPVLIIRRIRQLAEMIGLNPLSVLKALQTNVVGIDLNPLACVAARTNYLLALGDLLTLPGRGVITVPVYLADSILPPGPGRTLEDAGTFPVPTTVGRFRVPAAFSTRQRLDALTDRLDEAVYARPPHTPEMFLAEVRAEAGLSEVEYDQAERPLKALYRQLLDLHKEGLNGVWARIIRNAFAPLFIGRFDYVVGNPPWVNWESLPDDYREETKPLWVHHGLFPHSGMDTILGKGKKDVSMLMSYVAMDDYLKDTGKLGFLITQSVFKTAGAGQGFRRFRLGSGTPVAVVAVDDMADLKPFEGASNRTAIVVLERGRATTYPVPYSHWYKPGGGSVIPEGITLEEVTRDKIVTYRQFVAEPVDEADPTAPWISGRPRALKAVKKVLGASDYQAKAGVCTWLNGVYWLEIVVQRTDGLVEVSNLTEAGKREVENVRAPIEPDLLYPLLRGRDVGRWQALPQAYILMVQDPEKRRGYDEDWLHDNYKKTHEYLKRFEPDLRSRSGYRRYFRDTDPFYSMFDIGDYTFAPYKVVWPNIGSELTCAVVSSHQGKTVVPQHIVTLVPLHNAEEAHFVCAVVNSSPVNFTLQSYSQKGGKSFGTPHVLENVRVPHYDQTNPTHCQLAALSQQAHEAAAAGETVRVRQIEAEIDRLAAELWGLTEEELREIQESLEELG